MSTHRLGAPRTPIPRKRRKRRKPRLRGTACVGGKRCIATYDHDGRRYCAKHLADRLFSEKVRARYDGGCWAYRTLSAPGVTCNGETQCCHIVSRRYQAVRWAPANAVPMCMAHHVYFTHHPMEWEEVWGSDWDWLRRMALSRPPMDPIAVVAELRGE